MNGRGRRSKGVRAELEVEKLIRERGLSTERAIGGRAQVHGDIQVEGMAIDVKRQERLCLPAWSRKLEADVPSHVTPAIAYRTSRDVWRVSLPLADLLDLLEEAKR